jgi:hypothetical protein
VASGASVHIHEKNCGRIEQIGCAGKAKAAPIASIERRPTRPRLAGLALFAGQRQIAPVHGSLEYLMLGRETMRCREASAGRHTARLRNMKRNRARMQPPGS